MWWLRTVIKIKSARENSTDSEQTRITTKSGVKEEKKHPLFTGHTRRVLLVIIGKMESLQTIVLLIIDIHMKYVSQHSI